VEHVSHSTGKATMGNQVNHSCVVGRQNFSAECLALREMATISVVAH